MNNNSLAFRQAIHTQQTNNIHKIGLPYSDNRHAIYTQYTCNIHTIDMHYTHSIHAIYTE